MNPYYQDNHDTLYCMDFRKNDLPDESVQMVCTSPPYWGLRKYSGEQELVWGDNHCEHEWGKEIPRAGYRSNDSHPGKLQSIATQNRNIGGSNFCSLCGAWKGAYGLEPTPEMYIQHTIEILREIRRVLRKDGVVFWNIGDSYAGSGCGTNDYRTEASRSINKSDVMFTKKPPQQKAKDIGLKPKDLCLIPFRVAIAAQEDGWWVRSVIIWSKPNPMPESVTDRPTESHEYILMLTKSAKYYWDADAVREPHTRDWTNDGGRLFPNSLSKYKDIGDPQSSPDRTPPQYNPAGRNIRTVLEFNEDDEQGDKVYRVLQGCPIHSPLLHPDILKMLQDGEPQDCLLTHTLDRYSRLVPVLSFSLLSKLYHTNGGVHLSSLGFHHHAIECGQTPESIGDNRMLSLCCPDGGHKYGRQKVCHTKHIQKPDGSLFCSSDYSLQSDELIATLRSKEIRKTVSLIATNDSVFLQCPDRIVRTLQSLGCICSYNYYTTSHFPLQDVWKISTQPYPMAHFATFPEKLPELCIKAATPEVGCCGKCGAPWERIIEKIPQNVRSHKLSKGKVKDAVDGNNPDMAVGGGFSRTGVQFEWEVKTLGWQPTCKCNADKVPSIVLDPFAGAGTTLWEAKKLNRRAVGFDTSEEYCQLAMERNRQQVMA